MVEKCGGLPLAIIVLGGLLSTKKPQEWRSVRDHFWQRLRNDSIHIPSLLTLSFNDLPYQLKLCFLYLGNFPEDFEFFIEKAIRLLLAEGFIREDDDRVMEEVAKNHLDELINRSLVQIENICRGRVETSRIHDLLRDLAVQKAKELNFFHIYDRIHHPTCSATPTSSARRLVVYSETSSSFQHCNSLSRSLLLYDRDQDSFRQTSTAIFTRLRLLRLLHVENYGGYIDCHSLPEEIGQLVHLKVFNGKDYIHQKSSTSIVNLRKLQTLDLHSRHFPLKLPIGIGKLQELRHLIGTFEVPLPMDNLTNLQTLKFDDPMPKLEKSPNLVSLELRFHCYRGKKMICREKGFPQLESLGIIELYDWEEWQVEKGAMPVLKNLEIKPKNSELRIPERLISIPAPTRRYSTVRTRF
ncbi:putative disease resistance RPP13-like protein 3 [Pistacia vera]|uniref:putative disease resistance RPP13-like protein 3 n=1 Tax=Pistacia vera TaxID=55513 RepID=UPI00126342DB|nr:putative disease resistance RPP13-like protein 3 [Pistacia vera]